MTPEEARLVDVELARRWYDRPSADLLRLYDERREVHRRKDARFSMWAAVAIYVAFALLDVLLIPDVAVITAAARLVFGLAAFALVEFMTRTGVRAGRFDAACAAIVVVCYLAWLGTAVLSDHVSTVSYYMVFGTIFMMVASLFFNFTPATSITASLFMLGAFFAAATATDLAEMQYLLVFGTFYISCFAFTAYVNVKLNVERYNVFLNALRAEMRQDEVTERSKDLLRLSNTDALTGLENRRSIDEKLRQHWDHWQSEGLPFAAILIDIDFFKSFNDHYGHQEGDRCLLAVGTALAAAIEPSGGSLGRYGGEEFIVVARVAGPEEVEGLCESIRTAVLALQIPHPHRRDGENFLTVSVGAALTRSRTGTKLERLVNEADQALYGAKACGRNCIRLFDPADPQSGDESENIAALLRIAIEQDLVSLVYQPIQSVATGRIEAAEALMRLRMLDGTAVPPSVFIPIAERTGAILELGRWAIRTACRDLLSDDRVPVVSINISAAQLRTPGFSASVAALLGELNVQGSRIAFEITEGLDLEMQSGALRCISELKQLGIRIWLDDFGTGFAGLSWLRLIDFDTVKIDRSFLADSGTPRGASMMRDIIALVRNRGHQILVEGVETQAQLSLMSDYRIDQVQGYLVGRPAAFTSLPPGDARRPAEIPILKSA